MTVPAHLCRLLAAALVACGGPSNNPTPAADRAAYREALTNPDAAAAVAGCAQIDAPLLRGDCVVGVMQLTGVRDSAFCAHVPPDTPFHPECWFTAADDPDLGLDARWELCAPAGAYGAECRQHQRGREAALVGATDVPVRDKVAVITALIARDADPLDAAEGRPDKTWYALWLGHHQHAGVVSLVACDQSGGVAAACEAATDQLIRHMVRQAVQQRPAVCADRSLLAGLAVGAGPTLGDEPAVHARAEHHADRACRSVPGAADGSSRP